MTNRLKRAAIAVAVAGALGGAASAHAVIGIKFDPTGSGGPGLGLDQFVWGANQLLGFDTFGMPGGTSQNDSDVQGAGWLIGQGKLTGTLLGGAPIVGSFTGFTYEFRIPVLATTVQSSLTVGNCGTVSACTTTFLDAASMTYGADNYFRIYATPIEPNQTAGTGFGSFSGASAGQSLIFEGKVNINIGAGISSYGAAIGTLKDIGDTGTLTSGGNAIKSVTGSGPLRLAIEQCSAADVAASLPQCVGGATFISSNYFLSDVEALGLDVDLANSIGTPFDQTPLPATIGIPVPKTVNGITPDFGAVVAATVINDQLCQGGGTPCDMIFQGTSADSFWKGNFAVPEPGSVALLGLGLGLLGGMARRKRS